jgi:hypothetical protein
LARVEARSSKIKKKRQMELTTSKPESGQGRGGRGEVREDKEGEEGEGEKHTNRFRCSHQSNIISK